MSFTSFNHHPKPIILTFTGTADAKEAFNVSIARAEGTEVKVLHKFHPAHVYSIFGDDEQIYGYQGLDIGLSFNANDMRPNLRVKHTKKLNVAGDDGPTDPAEVLREYLPAGMFRHLHHSRLPTDTLNSCLPEAQGL